MLSVGFTFIMIEYNPSLRWMMICRTQLARSVCSGLLRTLVAMKFSRELCYMPIDAIECRGWIETLRFILPTKERVVSCVVQHLARPHFRFTRYYQMVLLLLLTAHVTHYISKKLFSYLRGFIYLPGGSGNHYVWACMYSQLRWLRTFYYSFTRYWRVSELQSMTCYIACVKTWLIFFLNWDANQSVYITCT